MLTHCPTVSISDHGDNQVEDAKMLDNESMKQKLPWIRAIANQSTEVSERYYS